MAERSDHTGLDGGEVEHGWAGAVEIDSERPSTGLAPDPVFRKWVVLGVVTSGLLTAALVVVSTPDPTPEPTAAPSQIEQPVPTLVEPPPANVQPPVNVQPAEPKPKPSLAVAPTRTPKRNSPPPPPPRTEQPQASTTLANGSGAAAQPKPRAAAPVANPQPAPPKPEPAKTPTQPVEPSEELPPDIVPDPKLPDVEAWDEADEAALEQASEPS